LTKDDDNEDRDIAEQLKAAAICMNFSVYALPRLMDSIRRSFAVASSSFVHQQSTAQPNRPHA